jgi:hypothetical protein
VTDVEPRPESPLTYEDGTTPPRPRARTGLVIAAAALLLVILVGALVANTGSKGSSAKSAVTSFAAGKKGAPFTASDASFKAVFPTTPKRQEQQVPAGATSLRLVQYTSELSSDLGFSAGWFRLPTAPAPEGVKTFLDATVNGSVAAIKGKLLSSKSLNVLGSNPAVEYTATAPEKHFVKARTILVGGDVFILQVVSDQAEPIGYARFVDSFTVLPSAK